VQVTISSLLKIGRETHHVSYPVVYTALRGVAWQDLFGSETFIFINAGNMTVGNSQTTTPESADDRGEFTA